MFLKQNQKTNKSGAASENLNRDEICDSASAHSGIINITGRMEGSHLVETGASLTDLRSPKNQLCVPTPF